MKKQPKALRITEVPNLFAQGLVDELDHQDQIIHDAKMDKQDIHNRLAEYLVDHKLYEYFRVDIAKIRRAQ